MFTILVTLNMLFTILFRVLALVSFLFILIYIVFNRCLAGFLNNATFMKNLWRIAKHS